MDLNRKKRLNDKYDRFNSLLLYFMLDMYLPPEEWNDLNTINKYIKDDNMEGVSTTLNQGREILALQEFPVDWVGDILNFETDDPDEVKTWISGIINTLEVEAKKAGKL